MNDFNNLKHNPMYILKSARRTLSTNEYILFNSSKKTQYKIELSPEQAEQIRLIFSLTPVSPIEYKNLKLNEFNEVKI